MNKKASSWLFVAGLLASGSCFAELNAADQSYVDRLIKGGPSTLQASRPAASTTPSTVTTRRTQPRVTSTTPQVASSSSATAPASGNRSAVG